MPDRQLGQSDGGTLSGIVSKDERPANGCEASRAPGRWLSGLARAAVALAAIAPAACAKSEGPIAISSDAARVQITLSPFAFAVFKPDGATLLTTLPETSASNAYGAPGSTEDRPSFEGQALSGWDGYRAHEVAWTRGSRGRVLERTSSSVRIAIGSGDELVMDLSVAGPRVRVSLSAEGSAVANKLGAAFALPEGERFFGLGERFATFDHRGQSLYSWAEEGGLGAGEDAPAAAQNPYPNGPSMTWFPVPFLLSNRGYGLFADTTARVEWHLGSERPDAWRVAANARRIDLILYVHDSPLETLRDYTADTGRPAPPAPWAFGPRRIVGLGDQVNGVDEWRLLRSAKVPTTGLDDNVHFLPQRSEAGREEALRGWTTKLHAAGFKVLGYYTPYVSQTLPSGAADLAEGLAHGYFVRAGDGSISSTFFSSGEPQKLATIDLTNPAAVTWFQTLLSRALALGYDGWMHDFGEYLPRDALLFDGRRGEQAHNDFPRLSAKAAFELLERERPGDYLFYVRSGTAGSQAVAPAVWSGDPEASFDETTGLPANLRAGLSLSMSGVPYWGSDIGGYKCLTPAPHDKELYLRWAQVGAVSTLMMDDTACFTLTGSGKKWTLWSDAETTAIYAAQARFHTRLQPYFLTLSREASASGRPLMIHPSLAFPGEPEAFAADDSFFLGPALFAAPVVRRGRIVREVWLPPGRYVDLDDLSLHEGGARASLAAPLQKLPLLLVEGNLLPLLDASIETLAPATDGTIDPARVADRLDVQVALGPGRSAQLILADGTELVAERRKAGLSPTAGVATVAETDLAECALCSLAVHQGGVDRLRLNGALDRASELVVDDVRVSAKGPTARRVRWDVFRLPPPGERFDKPPQ